MRVKKRQINPAYKVDTTTVVLTGEEDEETIHQVLGKLYVLLFPQNKWTERGTGQLRLNVRRFGGGGARLRELLG